MNQPFRFITPPPDVDRKGDLERQISDWFQLPLLRELVGSFGADIDWAQPVRSVSDQLLAFSELWDYRRRQTASLTQDTKEHARWLLESSELTGAQAQLVRLASEQLGLIGTSLPLKSRQSYILVLGGARLSCLLRARHALNLIRTGQVSASALVLLASMRPVATSERDATDTYALHAQTEVDLMEAALGKTVEGLPSPTTISCEKPSHENLDWMIKSFASSVDLPDIHILSAPSTAPEQRRANSADTFQFFLEHFGLEPGHDMLHVTSQQYVPYQQLEALRTEYLSQSHTVDTIGYPSSWSSELQGMTEPTNYLQEMRSTIQSANRLLVAM